ncbi:MAG: phosphatase PAP2 family protein, partial [Lentisphaeria bacterium]|nr:phosphatase PAP2 family protein [Lentisphaeria bacterium]
PTIELLVKSPSSFSFPSGHTFAGFASAVTVFLNHKKEGAAAIVLASLIAFSRMYIFVHFPTDILGGILFSEEQKTCIGMDLRRISVRKSCKFLTEQYIIRNKKEF